MSLTGPEHLIVGVVQKPHGIRGELVIRLETDRPKAVFRAGRVLLLGDPAGKPTGSSLTVERVRAFKKGLLLKAVGHTSLNDEIEALRGRTLLLAQEEAPPLDADEVWVHELVGMRVMAGEDEVGVVQDVYDIPPEGHMLGIAREGKTELLIPLVKDLVPRIDREARVVEIEPRTGLLDL